MNQEETNPIIKNLSPKIPHKNILKLSFHYSVHLKVGENPHVSLREEANLSENIEHLYEWNFGWTI